jgi:hypothetical protein
MTEAVVSVQKAFGIIRDRALLITGQCADRGSQLLHAVEDRPIAIPIRSAVSDYDFAKMTAALEMAVGCLGISKEECGATGAER